MNPNIKDIINHSSFTLKCNSKEYNSLTVNEIKSLCESYNMTQREMEIYCLSNEIIPERYHRNLGTLGFDGQIMLLNSKVAIIGAGGLGGTLFELLLRVGIGEIVICDGDSFIGSNLNRQLLSSESLMGQSKVAYCIAKAKEINSSLTIYPVNEFLTYENGKQILEGCNVVVDALDNIKTRLILEKITKQLNIPLVHGAIGGFYGQIMTIFPEDKGLKLIYGDDPDLIKGIETDIGTPTTTPLIVAGFEAQEVIKIIIKKGILLRNSILSIDIFENNIKVLNL